MKTCCKDWKKIINSMTLVGKDKDIKILAKVIEKWLKMKLGRYCPECGKEIK